MKGSLSILLLLITLIYADNEVPYNGLRVSISKDKLHEIFGEFLATAIQEV